MSCLVSGCNFLLRAIHHEAFTYEEGVTRFVLNDGAGKRERGLGFRAARFRPVTRRRQCTKGVGSRGIWAHEEGVTRLVLDEGARGEASAGFV
eukprot:364090-Chlamydomonas_euryale.AAC.4